MTEKKMTYAQALDNAIASVSDDETRARLEDLKASLVKKSPLKKVDNSEMENAILEALKGGSLTPTELAHKVDAPNTQKIVSVVKGMASVSIEKKGKKVIYSLA